MLETCKLARQTKLVYKEVTTATNMHQPITGYPSDIASAHVKHAMHQINKQVQDTPEVESSSIQAMVQMQYTAITATPDCHHVLLNALHQLSTSAHDSKIFCVGMPG